METYSRTDECAHWHLRRETAGLKEREREKSTFERKEAFLATTAGEISCNEENDINEKSSVVGIWRFTHSWYSSYPYTFLLLCKVCSETVFLAAV